MIDDHGRLQAELFDTFFVAFDHSRYERFPIDHHDADLPHFLSVMQHRLSDWAPLGEIAGWCLPIDLVRSDRSRPTEAASYYLLAHLMRPLLWLGMIDQMAEPDGRIRIEEWQYRKAPLCDRFLSFETLPIVEISYH